MTMEEFYERIGELFKSLKHPTLDFEYNVNTGEYVSIDTYEENGNDYIVVVRKDGTVEYGVTDGIEFYSEGTLGKINIFI